MRFQVGHIKDIDRERAAAVKELPQEQAAQHARLLCQRQQWPARCIFEQQLPCLLVAEEEVPELDVPREQELRLLLHGVKNLLVCHLMPLQLANHLVAEARC